MPVARPGSLLTGPQTTSPRHTKQSAVTPLGTTNQFETAPTLLSAAPHLWADTPDDEGRIWREFRTIVEAVEEPVLIHYGNYEMVFSKVMMQRYGELPEDSLAAKAIRSSVNLLYFLFAQVYFPTYSNGLKDVASCLGYRWSSQGKSGLDSIIWRAKWERSRDGILKETLVTYNLQDCIALENLATMLVRLCGGVRPAILKDGADFRVVFDDEAISPKTWWGQFSSPIPAFELVNAAARWDRQHDKVQIGKDEVAKRSKRNRAHSKCGIINKEVTSTGTERCPVCLSKAESRYCRRRTKILYDIRFSRFGVRRWIVKHHFRVYSCPSCHKCFGVPFEFWPMSIYGRNLVSLFVFETIQLRVPQRIVAESLKRLFGLRVSETVANGFKYRAAKFYSQTRLAILAEMIRGALIHADETPIVLKHGGGYVWVFADFRHVAYFYTETREGDFVQRLLKDFHGVLVSDFYAAYDSLPCPQQKCLLHLMRDLNDEVLSAPFNDGLKQIVGRFGELLRKIVDTVDRRGLKRRFLRKHLADVCRFYKEIERADLQSEAALKCKERLERNRNKLFTFLSYDGVPWNNNNAEHAIKAFAKLRRTITGLSTPNGMEDYLILMSVCQTCKYMGVDFLEFLRSGEKDIHAFAESRKGRRGRQQVIQPANLPADEGGRGELAPQQSPSSSGTLPPLPIP